MRSTIVLPSEIQSREFDSKLLTACVLAEAGRDAIIGPRHEIHNKIGHLKASVYLAKDIAQPSARILKVMRGLGYAVALLDEEGVIWPSEAGYYGRRTTPQTASMMDLFCTWGPRNHVLTENIPGKGTSPVVETGNPRNDLLRPELRSYYQGEVDALRARFGTFVLLNSNFGMVNPASMAKSRTPEVMKSQHPDIMARFERRKKVFIEMYAMVPDLCAAFPNVTFVVRPHPNEQLKAWTDLTAASANLHVIREGEVIPWLLAANAMIHNQCSTGVESFMLNRVSISYKGIPEAVDDGLSADAFSEVVNDTNGVIHAVRKRLDGGPTLPDQTGLDALKAHFVAMDGPLAADRLAAQLLDMPTNGSTHLKDWVRAEKRGLEKRLLGLIPGHKAGAGHNLRRYPGVSLVQIHNKIARLRRALDRFHDIDVEKISGQIYKITPPKN